MPTPEKIVPFSRDSAGTIPGEGAVALVLKRVEDAIADGDRIYSVIEGIGSAVGGECEAVHPREQTYLDALDRAYQEAEIDPASVSYIEAHGSGNEQEDKVEASALKSFFKRDHHERPIRVSSCMGFIGHTGAASGLASIAKACLSLYQEVIPGIPGHDRAQSHFDSTALPGLVTASPILAPRPQEQPAPRGREFIQRGWQLHSRCPPRLREPIKPGSPAREIPAPWLHSGRSLCRGRRERRKD